MKLNFQSIRFSRDSCNKFFNNGRYIDDAPVMFPPHSKYSKSVNAWGSFNVGRLVYVGIVVPIKIQTACTWGMAFGEIKDLPKSRTAIYNSL